MIFADRRAWNCFAVAALLALSPLLHAESAPLRVRFGSHDHARDGQPIVLGALLFTPDEACFPQPYPAVVVPAAQGTLPFPSADLR